MNLYRLWQGKLPLDRAFWSYAVIGVVVVNVVTSFCFLIFLSLDTRSSLSSRAMSFRCRKRRPAGRRQATDRQSQTLPPHYHRRHAAPQHHVRGDYYSARRGGEGDSL